MNKNLKYIDGNSDKFWKIEVNETSYTVTYGRNGTGGTSQTKTFPDAATCLKTAEKLWNEKIKKGYSESGEVSLQPLSSPSKKSTSDLAEILLTYDNIVKAGKVAALLPFLDAHAKGNLEALKKQIRKSKKYWMDYVDFSKEPYALLLGRSGWGVRGDVYQKEIIVLSALAVFNKSDASSWNEFFEILGQAKEPQILAVLKWAKPTWLSDYLLETNRKTQWLIINYQALRFLESHALISRVPELYALSIANFSEWTAKIKPRAYIDDIVNDPLAYERDVPELFNYQTMLHANTFRDHNSEAYNAHNMWEIIFDTLLKQGKINRSYFVEQTILLQTKDWNNAVKSFFRKQMLALGVTPADLLLYQESIFAGLQNPYAPIVNFSVDLCKKIHPEDQFNTASFLDWLSALMMSADQKTAIKAVLPILEKINTKLPKLNGKITELIADVYIIPDLSLQDRATKILVKIAKVKDRQLREKLSGYVPLMQGNIPDRLRQFIDVEDQDQLASTTETYQYVPSKEKLLLREIQMPENWNDIVFLFGKFIASDEIAAAELLLNTFIMQRELFPADYAYQLQPYAKQLEKKYFENINKSFIDVFLRQKIADFNYPFRVQDPPYVKIKTLLLIKPFLQAVQQRMNAKTALPMLSLPSHLPHWVAPKILIQRLIDYQESGTEVNQLDLSIAIARMPRENVEEALPLLKQLNGELKNLMAYCLGEIDQVMIQKKGLFTKFLSKINISGTENLNELWAMAARTHHPEGIFTEFEDTNLEGLPFVVQPFKLIVNFEERWNEWENYQTKQKERSPSWQELNFVIPPYKSAAGNFLYALDLFARKNTYEYLINNEGNVYFWHSLMPQNADALCMFLLRSSCNNSSIGGQELKGFLHLLMQPNFFWSEISFLLFACTFFQEKKDIRMMAAEVLIDLIEKRAIDLSPFAEKIAYLAANRYGPYLRLSESVATLKDVSLIHNLAFLKLMEGIFKGLNLKEKLPVNFKKTVENYVDVLYKTNQQPDEETIFAFQHLKDHSALKPLVKQILRPQE